MGNKLIGMVVVAGALIVSPAVGWAQSASPPPSHVFFGVRPGDAPGPGAAVGEVAQSGTGATLGLRSGDVIIAINDQPVADTAAMIAQIQRLRPGDSVKVRVRRGSETIELSGLAQAGTPISQPRRATQ